MLWTLVQFMPKVLFGKVSDQKISSTRSTKQRSHRSISFPQKERLSEELNSRLLLHMNVHP